MVVCVWRGRVGRTGLEIFHRSEGTHLRRKGMSFEKVPGSETHGNLIFRDKMQED